MTWLAKKRRPGGGISTGLPSFSVWPVHLNKKTRPYTVLPGGGKRKGGEEEGRGGEGRAGSTMREAVHHRRAGERGGERAGGENANKRERVRGS